MAIYLGEQQVKTHLGSLTTEIKDNFTSLDWEYTDGEFLFSVNNITPEMTAKLDEASKLQLAVVRYVPANVVKRSRSSSRKTYPVEITESKVSSIDDGWRISTRLEISQIGEYYKNINATNLVENIILNDNRRIRQLSDYATSRTFEVVDYVWREYGFALVDVQTYALVVLLESKEKLRVKVVNSNIFQVATSYNVINKKEVEVID